MKKGKKNKFNAHEHKYLLELEYHIGVYGIKSIEDVYDVSHVDYFINSHEDIALFESRNKINHLFLLGKKDKVEMWLKRYFYQETYEKHFNALDANDLRDYIKQLSDYEIETLLYIKERKELEAMPRYKVLQLAQRYGILNNDSVIDYTNFTRKNNLDYDTLLSKLVKAKSEKCSSSISAFRDRLLDNSSYGYSKEYICSLLEMLKLLCGDFDAKEITDWLFKKQTLSELVKNYFVDLVEFNDDIILIDLY